MFILRKEVPICHCRGGYFFFLFPYRKPENDTKILFFHLACHCSLHLFHHKFHFYNNGIVEEDLSHGSPYGGPYSNTNETDHSSFWPYQVWSYQSDDASYTKIGSVTDWNKKEWPDSIDGFSAFPDSIDKDQDGIVYILTNTKGKQTAIDTRTLPIHSQKRALDVLSHFCICGSQAAHRPAHLRRSCPSILRTLLRGRSHHILCILRINACAVAFL